MDFGCRCAEGSRIAVPPVIGTGPGLITSGPLLMLDLDFVKVGPGKYQKWNPMTQVRTTLIFQHNSNGTMTVTERVEQPKQIVADIIDLNVKQQNEHDGRYGGDLITQQTRIPLSVHRQLMKQCGYQPGHGYDEKKYRQILNDRDHYKLKTVSGTI